jgi:hypothetical protein
MHEVNLEQQKAVLGPLLAFDAASERFTGPMAERANELVRGDYRPHWQIPRIE